MEEHAEPDERYLDKAFSFTKEDLRDPEKRRVHKRAVERLKDLCPDFSLEETPAGETPLWVHRMILHNRLNRLLETLFLAEHDSEWRRAYWSHKVDKQNMIQASCGDYEGLSRAAIKSWVFSIDPFPEQVWDDGK